MCLAYRCRHAAPIFCGHAITNNKAGIEITHSGDEVAVHPLASNCFDAFKVFPTFFIIHVDIMSEVIFWRRGKDKMSWFVHAGSPRCAILTFHWIENVLSAGVPATQELPLPGIRESRLNV